MEYEYDALGRRTAMTDTLGVTRYEYDDLGRMVSVSDPITGTVAYGYDLAGNRTQLVYPDGQVVTYIYDADNRLVQVEDWDGGTTRYEYDAAGRLTHTTLPNGVVTSQQYDDADRLIRLTHTAADDTVLSDYQYQLDGVGNRLWVTETLTGTTRLITNPYDALNRLTGSVYSTSESFAYVYDAVGNRTPVTSTTPLSGTVVTTYTYDAANRLTYRARSDDRSYTYDWSDRNQMLREWTAGLPVHTFTYNAAGRMTQATVFTLTTRFTYNGDGARRVVEVVGQSTTLRQAQGRLYTVDYATGNRILAETMPTSTVTYLYGHDCLGEFRDDEPALSGAEGWLYYLNDATGYVRQGADEQGQVTSAWLFDPDSTVTVYECNEMNRLLQVCQDAGGLNLYTSYTYDRRGHQETVTNANGVVQCTVYNAHGLPAQEIADADGPPGGSGQGLAATITFGHDDLLRLIQVTDANGNAIHSTLITDYAYDVLNHFNTLAYANGLTNRVDYNALNWTTRASVASRGGGTALADYRYGLDNVGNRTFMQRYHRPNQPFGVYECDGLYQLHPLAAQGEY